MRRLSRWFWIALSIGLTLSACAPAPDEPPGLAVGRQLLEIAAPFIQVVP